MIPIIRAAAAVAVATLCSAAALPSAAQPFPSRPARIIVPFPPGQAADTFARLAAERLSATWGQTVVVENRAGGAGMIGAEAAARAKPDGYTVLMGSAGPISINPHVFSKLPYDAQKDFVPLAQVVALPLVIVAHPSLPVRSVKELLALARSRPGQLQYASAGPATSQHLAGELFASTGGVKMVHVPYKGSGPALQDLLGGHVTLMVDSLTSALPSIQSGRLRAIGVTTRERVPAAPSIPAIGEQLPGYEAVGWIGALGVAGTPPDVVARWSNDLAALVKEPAMRERIVAQAAVPATLAGPAFGAFLAQQHELWGKVVRLSGTQLD
ncbi:MAG: Bug family tripartite tricarboxylate transporter substrate binding protein [bacterium]|jgi:tripartite-type tricarboxylate transporter receptor subunit TctC|nr:tripartite tricarboxylate transporter substrate binding protein [Betaproteobacteria bacterium]